MKYTANYNLKKPEGTDVINIDDLNDNADIIDSELKKLNDAIKDLDADGITLPDGKTISEKFEEITEEVGNIQELNTDEKANIVAAINEIYQALLTHQQNTNQEIGQVASDLAAHKAEDVHNRIAVGSFIHDETEGIKKVVVGFRPKYIEYQVSSSGHRGALVIFNDIGTKALMANSQSFSAHAKNSLGITIHNDGFSIPLTTNDQEVSYIAIG